MTNMQLTVLASLALLGACEYKVTLGGGGGEQQVFDATKVNDLVKQVARKQLGEPSAVRCPPKMQFVPRDRYVCQFDFDGQTYDVAVTHGLFMSANAKMTEPRYGYEPLARDIEDTWKRDGETIDVDCSGVVVSAKEPHGRCALADGREVDVEGSETGMRYKIVEPGVSKL